MPEERICQYGPCSQPFTPSPRHTGTQKFCSRPCYKLFWKAKGKKEYGIRVCKNPECSMEFEVSFLTRAQKFCSAACCGKAWRETNVEKIKAYRETWEEEHRNEISAYQEAHREEKIVYQRAYYSAHREEMNAYTADYYVKHREDILSSQKEYAAKNPEKVRSRRAASLEKHRDGRNARARTHYAGNREEEIAKVVAYYKKHPEVSRASCARRRSRKMHAPINDLTAAQWQEILVAYNHRCVYCPDTCWRCRQKKHRLTQDHIIPLSKGGSNTVSNIAPSCQSCNSKKGVGAPLRAVQPLLLTIA